MRSRLALPGLLLLTAAPAQDVVQVPDARYGHDPELGLLVVAMTGQEVQEQWSGTKAGVMAGQLFTFVEPVATIVTGTGYEAVDDAGSPLAVYFTDLPLVHVTVGQEVPDEPKVPAQFSLWSAQQSLQAMPIGIEVRRLVPDPSQEVLPDRIPPGRRDGRHHGRGPAGDALR